MKRYSLPAVLCLASLATAQCPKLVAHGVIRAVTTSVPYAVLYTPTATGQYLLKSYVTLHRDAASNTTWDVNINWTDSSGFESASLGHFESDDQSPSTYVSTVMTLVTAAQTPITYTVTHTADNSQIEIHWVLELAQVAKE